MTYRGFHFRITLPLLALCFMYWTITAWSAAVLLPLLALNVIVVAFTYPWDNSAVRRGIWDFPEDRLLFRIDKLPIEEISFFVLQTLQVSFLTLALCSAIPAMHRYEPVISIGTLTNAGLLFVVWGIIGLTTRRWHEPSTIRIRMASLLLVCTSDMCSMDHWFGLVV